MCLIALAWKAHPRYPLMLATNRDEMHGRRSEPLGYWADTPDVLGGRDIEKGGGWLAANTDGRWAAVTNFRDGKAPPSPAPSRGHLVKDYVESEQSAMSYAATIGQAIVNYPGCNVLIAEPDALYFASNRYPSVPHARTQQVKPGIHALSNHLLDTPWPKVERCRQHMQTLLDADGDRITGSLFELLADRMPADDADLPSTGISLDRERVLSAPFIVAGEYGTRASTVMLMDTDGTVQMHERGFGADGAETGRRSFTFNWRDRGA